ADALTPFLQVAPRAGVGDLVGRHQPVPDEQHHKRADHGADQAGALIGPIPADRLADEGCDERANDAEHGGEDEARRIVRSRRQKTRDDAGNETDDDDPDDVHGDLAMKWLEASFAQPPGATPPIPNGFSAGAAGAAGAATRCRDALGEACGLNYAGGGCL